MTVIRGTCPSCGTDIRNFHQWEDYEKCPVCKADLSHSRGGSRTTDYQQALENAALDAKVVAGVRELAEKNAALRSMLKRLEWSDHAYSSFDRCPICKGRADYGHAPDCALAALLKGADNA